MKRILSSVAAIVFVGLSPISMAGLITAAPATGTNTVFTSELSGTAAYLEPPSAVVGGYTVSAPVGEKIWYGAAYFSFDDNGYWENLDWVGGYCFSGSCTATIDLGGSFSSVGGFMNYATGYGAALITALAADGTTVLESYDLTVSAPISTSGGFNDGVFRGISRASADIAYFQISGSYLVMNDITVDGGISAGVPEPASLMLLGLGLAGIAAVRRRKI